MQKPQGRRRNVSGEGKGVIKRGSGLGTGPTGESGLDQNTASQVSRPQAAVHNQTGASQRSGSYNAPQSGGNANAQRGSYNAPQPGSAARGSYNVPPAGGNANTQRGSYNTAGTAGNVFGTGAPKTGTTASSSNTQQYSSTGGTQTTTGKRSPLFMIIAAIIVIVLIVVLIRSCSGGSSSSKPLNYNSGYSDYSNNSSGGSSSSNGGSSSNSGYSYQDVSSYDASSYTSFFDQYASLFGGSSSFSTGWSEPSYSSASASASSSASSSSSAALNTSVASGAREKRTKVVGGGRDIVTILVYMCGADLESKSGMASSDLKEMTNADIGDNINLIVYTGGAKKWQNSVISSGTNQIYQVKSGGIACLNSNAGSTSMTSADTLASFIQWGGKNFPADRYELILWDHGSGSVSGYGYDEKYPTSGSMSLAGIDTALKKGGLTFDFIGFDTCLMATMETALMLDDYADYMIASEETEPGIGWYYTDWLTAFGNNTSMPTLQIGKNIIDGFITTCARQCQGQKATLSLTDLAELSATVPAPFGEFAGSITDLVKNNDYKSVSDARNNAREFASSSKIDQVDLTDFALRVGNSEGRALAEALTEAVKYNRTSSGMTNAYGLSIYFPYRNAKYVDRISSTYSQIGIDSKYTECIKAFASVEVAGQASSGGSVSSFGSLFGNLQGSGYDYYGSGSSGSSGSSYSSQGDMISSLLGSFLGGDYGSVSDFSGYSDFFSGRSIPDDQLIQYIQDNSLDPAELVWTQDPDGTWKMSLSDKDRSMIHSIDLNMFYDDGEGYINLGLDYIYDIDDDGNLVADDGAYWFSIDGYPVAYFHVDTIINGDDYAITGRVPAILNGEDRVDLIIVFNNEHPDGYIAGAYYVYGETEDPMSAKNLTELQEGDTLDFICDYYDYQGNYQDSYQLGERMTVSEEMVISNVDVGSGAVKIMYCFTDMYNQTYWTEAIVQ